MICRKCGHQNEDGVLFCEQCKEDLEMPVSTATGGDEKQSTEVLPDVLPLTAEDDIPVLEPVTPEPSVAPYSDTLALEPADPVPVLSPETETLSAESVKLPVVPEATSVVTPAGSKPKLEVIRGLKVGAVYPLYEGKNYLGRTDDQPVDIDLDDQESPDRIWTSRQHAVIHFEDGKLTIEDLKSLNGTFVNRARVHPGQLRELSENDVVQIGTVHMKVVSS
jgi:hypothetical protein